ncbi:hypothetical protein [Streptomyces sp. NPDC001970]
MDGIDRLPTRQSGHDESRGGQGRVRIGPLDALRLLRQEQRRPYAPLASGSRSSSAPPPLLRRRRVRLAREVVPDGSARARGSEMWCEAR